MKGKNRVPWLDTARSLAILSVVWAHATTTVCSLKVSFISDLSAQDQMFAFVSLVFGRIGVPLFFMLSGYLLLDREYDGPGMVRFWKDKCLHLFLVTEIWMALYFLFLFWKDSYCPLPSEVIRTLLFLQDMEQMGHVWYLPRLLGCYIFLPLVSIIFHAVDWKQLCFPMAVAVLYCFGFDTVELFLKAMEEPTFEVLLAVNFSGGVYGLYIVMGYMIRKGLLRRVPSAVLVAAALLSGAVLVKTMQFFYSMDHSYNMWYNNLFVLLIGMAVFELLSRRPAAAIGSLGVTQSLCRCSFGIFLLHYPIKMLLTDWVNTFSCIPVGTAVLFVTSLALSWAISALLLRGPKPVRWLLLSK